MQSSMGTGGNGSGGGGGGGSSGNTKLTSRISRLDQMAQKMGTSKLFQNQVHLPPPPPRLPDRDWL
jgi:hypothetical protein